MQSSNGAAFCAHYNSLMCWAGRMSRWGGRGTTLPRRRRWRWWLCRGWGWKAGGWVVQSRISGAPPLPIGRCQAPAFHRTFCHRACQPTRACTQLENCQQIFLKKFGVASRPQLRYHQNSRDQDWDQVFVHLCWNQLGNMSTCIITCCYCTNCKNCIWIV